jgi:hypothetical protein
MREMLFIGVHFQITWRPSLFLIDLLDELLIPIGTKIIFYILEKAYWRVKEIFLRNPQICFSCSQKAIAK